MTSRTPYLIERGPDDPAFSYELPSDVVPGDNGIPRYRDTGAPVPVLRRTQMPRFMAADRTQPSEIDPTDRHWLSAPLTRPETPLFARDRIVGAWDTETARQAEAQRATAERLSDPWRVEAARRAMTQRPTEERFPVPRLTDADRQANVAGRSVADARRAETARHAALIPVDHDPFTPGEPADQHWLSVPLDRPQKPEGWPLLPKEQPLGAWDVAEDLVRSTGGGVNHGVASILGLPADLFLLGRDLSDRAQSWRHGRPLAEVQAENEAITPLAGVRHYSSEALDERLPLAYEPKTTAGQYFKTAADLATSAAVTGGAGAAGKTIWKGGQELLKAGGRKVMERAGHAALTAAPREAFLFGAVPGVASEAAGQLTAGTPWEPYARAGAAVAAGLGATVPTTRGRDAGAVAESVKGLEVHELDKAQDIYREARASGVPLGWPDALKLAVGPDRLNELQRINELQQMLEASGRMRPFFANQRAQIDATAGRYVNTAAQHLDEPARQAARDMVDSRAQEVAQRVAEAGPRATPRELLDARPAWTAAQTGRQGSRSAADQILDNYVTTRILDAAGGAVQGRELSTGALQRAMADHADLLHASPVAHQRLTNIVVARNGLARIDASPIGKLASRDAATGDAVKALFAEAPGPDGAKQILDALTALHQSKPEIARHLMRTHLENTFNGAVRALPGDARPGWMNALREDPQRRESLGAAMEAVGGSQARAGFERFLELVAAGGPQLKPGNGRQGVDTAALNKLAGQRHTAELASRVVNRLPVPDRIQKRFERWQLGRDLNSLADVLTDPRAIKTFRAMAETSDGTDPTARFLLALKIASLAKKGWNGTAEEGEEPEPSPNVIRVQPSWRPAVNVGVEP